MNIKRLFGFAVTFYFAAMDLAWSMGRPPADPNAPQPPAWTQFVPILVFIGVLYMLFIRPQMQQKKQRDTMMSDLKKGDRVVTQGGLIVTIVNVGPDILDVKINDETKAKLRRSGVLEILAPAQTEPEGTVNGK